jgi:hypothetical protein
VELSKFSGLLIDIGKGWVILLNNQQKSRDFIDSIAI